MHSTSQSKRRAACLIAAVLAIGLSHDGLAAPGGRQPACAHVSQDGPLSGQGNAGLTATTCTPRLKMASEERGSKVESQAPPEAVPPPLPSPTEAAAERAKFTRKEQEAASIPGIPGARFWADSREAFQNALGPFTGPWLALSAGGEDSAFGAGLLTGLSQTARRPDYAVVTGVSSGALLAPFAFVGPARDADLKRDFTTITAADVFEDRQTVDSLMDTWPLREFIARRITAEFLTEIAAEHRRGRRLIVVTTNIDAGRPVAWNMGAIAAAGGDKALKLFHDILLATSAIPGLFPPVAIDVEANGRTFSEMHVDGGLAATIYIAPDSMLLASSTARLPASQITLILNSKLMTDFAMTDRSLLGVLGRSLSIGVKRASRSAAVLIAAAARRNDTEFNVAHVDQGFDFPSRGLFDPDYMTALFEAGVRQGRSDEPFRHAMPGATASKAATPQAAE